jgi:ribonuclease HII
MGVAEGDTGVPVAEGVSVSQQPDLSREEGLWVQGYTRIAGLDEAGRGAWAGPVVAAAVVLPVEPGVREALAPVRDSKLLSPRQRDRCYTLILAHCSSWGVGSVPAAEIDRIGILPATRLAMQQAVAALCLPPDYLLLDALTLPALALPQLGIIRGDRTCLSIAAASIIAKVTRDRGMIALDVALCGYGLARHKGYGTRAHLAALRARGATAEHRHSFKPLRALAEGDTGVPVAEGDTGVPVAEGDTPGGVAEGDHV